MEIFNRDIEPTPEVVNTNPDLGPLISNLTLSKEFVSHETAAVAWKTTYNAVGVLSLLCAGVATIYLGYHIALQPIYGIYPLTPLVVALTGAMGLVLQLVLLFGGIKERWLIHRFGAERLRCLKFQLFCIVSVTSNISEIASLAESESAKGIAKIEYELLGGAPALKQFHPSIALGKSPHSCYKASSKFVAEVFDVYKLLRINVQATHFSGRIAAGEKGAHIPTVLSDLFLFTAATLSFLEALQAGWHELSAHAVSLTNVQQAALNFLIWILFVFSALLAVYRQAHADIVNTDRYRQYLREVERIKNEDPPKNMDDLISVIWRMEEIALYELHAFCHDQERTSFLF